MSDDKPSIKVIKSRNSVKSRLSQACNRCRSKKIRCDGGQPTCSQCASVGIECATTDRLSRRAYPRYYTDYLEERVRTLEREVRLLRGHSDDGGGHDTVEKADQNLILLPRPALLPARSGSERLPVGLSSGYFMFAALEQTLQKLGSQFSNFNTGALLQAHFRTPLARQEPDQCPPTPPGLLTERYVQVFLRQWAPLFPVLKRDTLLRAYNEFVTQPDGVGCSYRVAQLHLVFAIAQLSSESPNLGQVTSYERQWMAVIETQYPADSLDALQCLVLAVLYCALLGDDGRTQHYKSLAVGLSQRLGLYRGQKQFPVCRTRQRISLTLYTLDCFTAASMGLPRLLREEEMDATVEYMLREGFRPVGDDDMSDALALLQASRILARVLEALQMDKISLRQMSTMGQELDSWYAKLPDQPQSGSGDDKARADDSRRPVLILAYYYIRSLIYCPVVGSEPEPRTATAVQSVCESSVRITYVILLLRERGLGFPFCLNRSRLLTVCASTLLHKAAQLRQEGSRRRDVANLVTWALRALAVVRPSVSAELEPVARRLLEADTEEQAPDGRFQACQSECMQPVAAYGERGGATKGMVTSGEPRTIAGSGFDQTSPTASQGVSAARASSTMAELPALIGLDTIYSAIYGGFQDGSESWSEADQDGPGAATGQGVPSGVFCVTASEGSVISAEGQEDFWGAGAGVGGGYGAVI
ncbi:putative transcription activator protein acu-15 [Ophiocordyceps camponoti-floridani]|uniref:Putative transcription activator protein acu-15 n=1 Tax=Ophiocordyceps camponoti-floridani TaxID=2030778 RepID=A0A8H4VGQ6_9HYPO|nr:putative transcription activator protein acu-15 [Ophiocordyceps camponoti-floridani]